MFGYEQGFCNSLTDVFSAKASPMSLDSVAHVSIDVQDHYIMSRADEKVAEHIGRVVAPNFTKQGIKNYWVYFLQNEKRRPSFLGGGTLSANRNHFNRNVKPHRKDAIIHKTDYSAIGSSCLESVLRDDKKETVVLTGFTLGVCVFDTLIDLRRLGYKVVLLRDGTDFDDSLQYEIDQITASGAVIAETSDVFKHMAHLRP